MQSLYLSFTSEQSTSFRHRLKCIVSSGGVELPGENVELNQLTRLRPEEVDRDVHILSTTYCSTLGGLMQCCTTASGEVCLLWPTLC